MFYEDALPAILATLDHEGIAAGTAALSTKRKRLAWLLEAHPYLPNAEMARLAGCRVRAVERARGRRHGSMTCIRPFVAPAVPPRAANNDNPDHAPAGHYLRAWLAGCPELTNGAPVRAAA